MDLKNKNYEKQFVSIDVSIFSIINNRLSVLLLKRKAMPYENMWSLIGGGVYNYESCEEAVARELNEKLNITNIVPYLSGVFSQPNRDIRFRNISISYYAFVQSNEFYFSPNSEKALDTKWFFTNEIPPLAFDHNKILENSLKLIQKNAYDISFLKPLLPKIFTLNDLQQIYESILNTKLDKRNFRRKIQSLDCLVATGEKNMLDTHKKSELYTLK